MTKIRQAAMIVNPRAIPVFSGIAMAALTEECYGESSEFGLA
jgi:hypothetical protein